MFLVENKIDIMFIDRSSYLASSLCSLIATSFVASKSCISVELDGSEIYVV